MNDIFSNICRYFGGFFWLGNLNYFIGFNFFMEKRQVLIKFCFFFGKEVNKIFFWGIVFFDGNVIWLFFKQIEIVIGCLYEFNYKFRFNFEFFCEWCFRVIGVMGRFFVIYCYKDIFWDKKLL